MKGGEEILKLLAGSLRPLLEQAPFLFEQLQELRLRADRPFFCKYQGNEYGFLENGRPVLMDRQSIGEEIREAALRRVSGREVRETLEYAGSYSLYAYEEELRQGFLTVQGGHRVGVAGKAVFEGGRIRTLRHVSFLNIRLAHQVKGCAETILPVLYDGERVCNTLILSPPGFGKTTLLRDMIRLISDGGKGHAGMTVGVADERSELAACYQGIPQNDVGIRTDVLDACPKAQGLFMLIRTMAPQLVAADEIGSGEDVSALRLAGLSGCSVLVSAHGASLREIRARPYVGELLEEGFFERYILLGQAGNESAMGRTSGKRSVGQIVGVFGKDGQSLPAWESRKNRGTDKSAAGEENKSGKGEQLWQ